MASLTHMYASTLVYFHCTYILFTSFVWLCWNPWKWIPWRQNCFHRLCSYISQYELVLGKAAWCWNFSRFSLSLVTSITKRLGKISSGVLDIINGQCNPKSCVLKFKSLNKKWHLAGENKITDDNTSVTWKVPETLSENNVTINTNTTLPRYSCLEQVV